MDQSLQIVKHLYDGDLPEEQLNALLEDAELKKEYHSMLAVKKVLDSRIKSQPNQETISHILNAAERSRAKKADWSISPFRIIRHPAVRWAAAACLALVAVVSLWNQSAVEDATSPPVAGKSVLGFAESPSAEEDNGLVWDDSDNLISIQQRIEILESRSEGYEWGDTATPLELIPGETSRNPRGALAPVTESDR